MDDINELVELIHLSASLCGIFNNKAERGFSLLA